MHRSRGSAPPVAGSLRPRPQKPQSPPNLMPLTDQEIEEEEAHFASVVAAFRSYTAHSVKRKPIEWTLC